MKSEMSSKRKAPKNSLVLKNQIKLEQLDLKLSNYKGNGRCILLKKPI